MIRKIPGTDVWVTDRRPYPNVMVYNVDGFVKMAESTKGLARPCNYIQKTPLFK